MKEKNPMQTWAKRGLQTALVTGGLLMLGTGIASADENVNPDTPASPLDLNVTVPIDAADNAIGTPLGQYDAPAEHTELSTRPLTQAVREAGHQLDESSPIGKSTLGATDGVAGKFTPSHRNLKGNEVAGDVVLPIQIVDNAVGVVGDAHVDGTSHEQNWAHDRDIRTSGKDSGIAGNVVSLDWAAPVQLAGNGVGVAGGSGAVHGGAAYQSATETGNIDTDGQGSGLSGNVVAGQFATPVQVSGNSISYLLGNAYSSYVADTSATSGGSVLSKGEGGAATGNVVGAPIALPVKFNGNAGGVWGSDADTVSSSSADAKAGAKRPGSLKGTPTYLETDGDDSFLAGNAAAAQLSPVANVAEVAATWIGNAGTGHAFDRGNTAGATSSTVDSGGFVKTTGDDATGSANVVDPAVALPVDVCGIGAAAIGNSRAACENTVDANAGNGSYTRANGGFLGGNVANTQFAGAPEVYGLAAGAIGSTTGRANEDKTVTAGGYDGSQGSDSSGSGNIVGVPVGVPAEVFGVGAAALGQGSAEAHETKVVRGGGGGNTADDYGFLSSNLGTVPASLPVQVFGAGAAVLGQGHGIGSSDTTSTAGSHVNATGVKGAGAGNIVEAPVSLPVQGHGLGAALGGIGTGWADNLTDSKAGGDADSDGRDGAIAGNIVKAPIAGAVTPAATGVAAAALGHGGGTNDISSVAGGNALTNGTAGTVAGTIVGADAEPVAQVIADSVSAAGVASGRSTTSTVVKNAGDDTTSGVEGSISGDILDLPVTAVPYVTDDAITAAGVAHSAADNTITATNGGIPTTAGNRALSGLDFYRVVPATMPVYGVPQELLGVATSQGTDSTDRKEPKLEGPLGNEMAADELPVLSGLTQRLPVLPTGSGLPQLPVLSGLTQRLPVLPTGSGLPVLSGLTRSLPTASALPQLPAMAMLPGVERADGPQISGLSALGQLSQVRHLVSLPASGLPTPALPGLPGRSDAESAPQLPARLPVKASLPTLSQLPAVTALPALPGTDTTAPTVELPVVPSRPAVGQVPALSGVDSSPLGALPSLAAKVTGFFKK
ncbi:PE-PGRS family protein [Amycolatopsis sp. PS_44_ISF1]|uniref:PE-PGRS family protein n=1 Tax=Amycolatopsis sp. PS_44_ISF1 TaxID=2974917 RepID=UPI0028DFC0E4|nr:PE-PGRS family protein [Amycolatopsis sp. PS_44_ISF1]MDT8910485.1 PE-PGRS family protein [Amycolatopsis sp. PS_44_ISF1]